MEPLKELWTVSEEDVRNEKWTTTHLLLDPFFLRLSALLKYMNETKDEDKDEEYSVLVLRAFLQLFPGVDTKDSALRVQYVI